MDAANTAPAAAGSIVGSCLQTIRLSDAVTTEGSRVSAVGPSRQMSRSAAAANTGSFGASVAAEMVGVVVLVACVSQLATRLAIMLTALTARIKVQALLAHYTNCAMAM